MPPEEEPLLATYSGQSLESTAPSESIRAKAQRALESPFAHTLVILLTLIDTICVFSGIAFLFLSSSTCEPSTELPLWLEMLDGISLSINSIFLLEILITVWAFGINYFNPMVHKSYAFLHIFDALIIITTFTLEAGLKGREGELAGLLIVFRLWRLVKLISGLAAGAGEITEEQAHALEEAMEEVKNLKGQLEIAINENVVLRQRLES